MILAEDPGYFWAARFANLSLREGGTLKSFNAECGVLVFQECALLFRSESHERSDNFPVCD
jgi:hypothetical protein